MKKRRIVVILLVATALLIPIIYVQMKDETRDDDPVKEDWAARLITPKTKPTEQYTIGDTIQIQIEVSDPNRVDSIQLFVDGVRMPVGVQKTSRTIAVETKNLRVGRIPVLLSFLQDGKRKNDPRTIELFSDIVPVEDTLTVVSRLPHQSTSYTQGLEFWNGRMFEGTGQWAKSQLLEVNTQTGEVLRSRDCDPAEFGEGITIIDSLLYQISYTSGRCYVYDIGFVSLKEFGYTGEGWGLCNNGKQILMSNGTDEIVWRDPSTFAITKTIQVFDNNNNYNQLNELELINGRLFANVYTENYILEIDTATGKVLRTIDCSGIVNEQATQVDYLNGIACNPETGKIYITGKLWPTLYEVTFD